MRNTPIRKWLYLFISVTILVICSAYCWSISQRSGDILGYFGWFFIGWGFSLLAAGVCLICRLLNFIKRETFSYIFVSVISFSVSLFGITKVEDMKHLTSIWGSLLFTGLSIGALLLADTFIIEILTPKKWKK